MRIRELVTLLLLLAVALVASGIRPVDRLTWLLEILPILIVVPLLAVTWRRFPMTPLVYRLVFVHALILLVGGHYTYEKVPLGEWAREAFGFARNHYDRLGHFAQGFVPAIAAREILIRRSPLRRGGWLFMTDTCVCLSASACFEMVEWSAALLLGSGADAYLATQGDPWDTQWDMFLALVGAIVAQLSLGGAHDRQMAALEAAA